MVAEVCLGNVGAIAARVSRFARNNQDCQLIEMCSLVDTLLIDHETVCPRRETITLLGLKESGGMSSTFSAGVRWRLDGESGAGELLILAPVGYLQTADQRLEKIQTSESNPNSRLRNFSAGDGPANALWFLEHGPVPVRRYGASGGRRFGGVPATPVLADASRSHLRGCPIEQGERLRCQVATVVRHVRQRGRAEWSF
jgi:hypothetical protein